MIFAAVTRQKEITPQPEEIAEAGWYPYDEAMAKLTYERDRKILSAAMAHVEKYYSKKQSPAAEDAPQTQASGG